MSAHPHSIEAKPPRTATEDDSPSTAELLDLFGNEYTREVFAAVAERPRGGRAVAEAADVSRPTAYRRLNELRDAGLVKTEMVVSEDGHHRERFEAVADGVSISIDDGSIEATVTLSD
jgi:DNA-binding transcriptional ArsR family regulator